MTVPVAVSVVIPTRNRAHVLPAALTSLVAQETEAPFEIVVVDNGSDDGTSEILERWRGRESRLRTLHESSVGRTPAMLTGMAAAEGPILLFTDDDVLADPGWIEGYVRFFDRHPDALLAGGPIRPIPPDGAWPGWFSPAAVVSLGMVQHDGERPLDPGEHVWGANMGVRASLFERVGSWDSGLGVRGDDHPSDPGMNEDIEFQYRAREAGIAVWFCPDAAIGHRAAPRSPGWCLRRGFANGRNSFHRRPWPGMPPERRRGPSHVATVGAWGSALARAVLQAAAFRLAGTRGRFEAAWSAAWSSGWRMEDALVGVRRGHLDAGVRRMTHLAVRTAARLAGQS